MIYLVDFDRTLFDSDAYNEYIVNHSACAEFRDEFAQVLSYGRDRTKLPSQARAEMWDKVTALITDGTLAFTPGELSHFLYPDAVQFLKEHGSEAVIVTYGETTRQRAKVESAIAGFTPSQVLYTGDSAKGEYLKATLGEVSLPAVFVDDLAEHLENVEAFFPGIELYEIRRDALDSTGRWKAIQSLAELT